MPPTKKQRKQSLGSPPPGPGRCGLKPGAGYGQSATSCPGPGRGRHDQGGPVPASTWRRGRHGSYRRGPKPDPLAKTRRRQGNPSRKRFSVAQVARERSRDCRPENPARFRRTRKHQENPSRALLRVFAPLRETRVYRIRKPQNPIPSPGREGASQTRSKQFSPRGSPEAKKKPGTRLATGTRCKGTTS
jgi:hypothetical protein